MSIRYLFIVMLAIVLLSVGCRKDKGRTYRQPGEAFEPNDSSRLYRRYITSQTDAGAADDAMLYAHHFDGDTLNGLGQRKVSAIVRHHSGTQGKVTVYVNLTESQQSQGRLEAIAKYLADEGVEAGRVALHTGSNPGSSSVATLNTASMYGDDKGSLRAVEGESVDLGAIGIGGK